MARGGVYDQLAGGFHRYSVDERWLVPHFEKMSYDNSELLKNYLHGKQVTGDPLFRETAEGIIGWVNGVLSDRERGGFYASQDADINRSMTMAIISPGRSKNCRAVLSPEKRAPSSLRYDVGHGQMHHNPAKIRSMGRARRRGDRRRFGLLESAGRSACAVRQSARARCAARRSDPTPFVDTTLLH